MFRPNYRIPLVRAVEERGGVQRDNNAVWNPILSQHTHTHESVTTPKGLFILVHGCHANTT